MYVCLAKQETLSAYKTLKTAGIEPTMNNMNRYINCGYLTFEVKTDGSYYCCYNDGAQKVFVNVATLKAN